MGDLRDQFPTCRINHHNRRVLMKVVFDRDLTLVDEGLNHLIDLNTTATAAGSSIAGGIDDPVQVK